MTARKRDHRGDSCGIIEPAPAGGNDMRDDIVSARWVAQEIAETARQLAVPETEPIDGAAFAAQIADAARRLDHTSAMARAFPLLHRARRGRVRRGEVIDCGDLAITGKHGSIEDIVAGLLAGKFDGLERDDEGFFTGIWP